MTERQGVALPDSQPFRTNFGVRVELAMMDAVERENMLASPEAQFGRPGELVGIATRNIAVNSHGAGGAGLQLGRAVEVVPVLEELR